MLDIQPITLIGKVARLEPLREAHITDLAEAGRDETIWRWMPYGAVTTEEKMRAWVQEILRRQASGTDLVFAVIHLASGKAIGSTRYMDIKREHRGVEVGGTWYATTHQRTGINTECKYLLFRHAFETLDCIRVQLKTDLRNERSQRAIERIGAQREGVLRNVFIMPDGYFRSSVYYSVLATEWPTVKTNIEAMMQRV